MTKKIDKEDVRITTIIIDTSAFHDVNSDFIGINSEMLPLFFESLKEKDILLLTHPILDGEIKKHLLDSTLVKNKQQLEASLCKTENVLKLAGCFEENLIKKIKAFDIKEALYRGYQDIYKDAVHLQFPDMENVFSKYFNSRPPFSETGKKKSEFPDAVIIESVSEYMENHINDSLLVVSRDGDWRGAFKGNENVKVVDSIEEAIVLINEVDCVLSDEMMDKIYESAFAEMKHELEFFLECECYDVPEYEFESDFEMESVEIVDFDTFFVPLKVSRNQMLLQTEIKIQVAGEGVIYDEDRSVWDSEDKCYWVREIADLDVKKAYGKVKAEILIEFDFDNLEVVNVLKAKLTNVGNIDLELDDYDISPIYSDEDMGEIYDALEGHNGSF